MLPFGEAVGFGGLDDAQAVTGEGFGGLPVDAVFGELLEGVESGAVEVEERAARCGCCEDAGEAGGGAGFEVAVGPGGEGG